jgi:glutamate-ammonia-ligase adenylyltransferase
MDALLEPTLGAPDELLAAEPERTIRESRSYEDFLDRPRTSARSRCFWSARASCGHESRAGRRRRAAGRCRIRALHRRVENMFAESHGRIRGQQTVLLALGKLGGCDDRDL